MMLLGSMITLQPVCFLFLLISLQVVVVCQNLVFYMLTKTIETKRKYTFLLLLQYWICLYFV